MAKRVGANKRNALAQRNKNLHKKKRKISVFMIRVIVVVVLIAMGGYGVIQGANMVRKHVAIPSIFFVNTIKVKGNHIVDTHTIKSLLQPLDSMSLLRVKKNKWETEIEKIAWVHKARLIKKLPSTIEMRIVERQPVALVQNGTVHMVDHDGIVLPLVPGYIENIPLVTGLPMTNDSLGGIKVSENNMGRLLSVMHTIEVEHSSLPKIISQIVFTQREKIIFVIRDLNIAATMSENNVDSGVKRLLNLTQSYQIDDSKQMHNINLCYENVAYVY